LGVAGRGAARRPRRARGGEGGRRGGGAAGRAGGRSRGQGPKGEAEKQAKRLSPLEAGVEQESAEHVIAEARRLAGVEAAARRAAEMKVAKQLASDRAKAVKRAHRAKDKAAAAANAARQAETKALASADIEKEWLERTPGAREVGA
ncbi:unnamed protein product, partial [Prorocentrum cordatum]